MPEAGADVVMVCRDKGRGEAALDEMRRDLEPGMEVGRLRIVLMDLASFASIRRAAEQLNQSLKRIDILINNAGIFTVNYTTL